ncbi:MAG: NarK/NasA family nitrate transporter [Pelagibacteraceae bacterium]|jgi:NNP family nitrate/nitrite transporter-like MFS transporter|nr:NarK/NasA family nitrate transporter [Pelagibacteraceae bacterium]MBT3902652.1 NarK/NasA family nitrate transporter [Pelagibacteraceae bacterium]MBT4646328.1 NarK/NasA family nitrate transporter [Pelagibacteraceae bacterium]MBT4951885.1 NarK/NasA family nitrate transporter [Pelagibacteraceae bacterium]MBT5213226.1 NarK/NasA family nitrate transporter [Pelagibacteraceae bacterium]
MSDLNNWNVEDKEFWESTGKRIATRNLWISIPSLLCGFAVWMMWGIIVVQMRNLNFSFSNTELFTLTSIAGLSGATLRIPSTFFIRIAGGRNTIFFTTALLMIPVTGTGFALQDKESPLWIFQLLALLSGFGGGNFASSMSNISFFFPKRVQGTSLGFNAGLGNFGVTTMQILVPLVMTIGIFGGTSLILDNTSGTLIGKIPAGTETFIHNSGFIWLIFLIPLAFAGWFGMNNIVTKTITPRPGNPFLAFYRISGLLTIGLITASIGLYLLLSPPIGIGLLNKWIVLPMVIVVTVLLMRYITRGELQQNLIRQYKIFKNKHTWAMTVIYTMTFGSFIGFSAAFPLSIKIIFGFSHVINSNGVITHDTINPNGPSALMFAWMAPFIGALIRPVGGWISDKVGGAKVTQIVSIVMIASSLGVAYYMALAYKSAAPEQFFWQFFILFIVLFTATGVGNGSTFRTIAVVFNEEQRGPALGWTSAVAAYGAFIIPIVLGEQISAKKPEFALIGFAIFYAVCLVLNWWFYLRPNAYIKNP